MSMTLDCWNLPAPSVLKSGHNKFASNPAAIIVVVFYLVSCIASYLMILFTTERQALHDWLAGTLVLTREPAGA